MAVNILYKEKKIYIEKERDLSIIAIRVELNERGFYFCLKNKRWTITEIQRDECYNWASSKKREEKENILTSESILVHSIYR